MRFLITSWNEHHLHILPPSVRQRVTFDRGTGLAWEFTDGLEILARASSDGNY